MPYLRFRCPAGHQFVSRARDTESHPGSNELDCRGVGANGSRCERRAAALIANDGGNRSAHAAHAT